MTEASEKRYNDRKIVENIMINSIEKTIELPIEQKHTGKGNPNAVFGIELNNRQKDLLEKLSEFDSKVIVDKKSVNMADLSALTAHTGDEFALFTKGKDRLVIPQRSDIMCKLFDEWRNEIKDYCRQQGLNFDTAEKLSQSWNKNTVALSYRDPSKGSNGLLDDTPCPLVLLIRREKNGKLVFEQTEHTKKYLA